MSLRHKLGCPCSSCRPLVGEASSRAKLKEGDVVAIRASGKKYRDIAAEFGISVATAWRIKQRRLWKHI